MLTLTITAENTAGLVTELRTLLSRLEPSAVKPGPDQLVLVGYPAGKDGGLIPAIKELRNGILGLTLRDAKIHIEEIRDHGRTVVTVPSTVGLENARNSLRYAGFTVG